jgi:hypothetical protein
MRAPPISSDPNPDSKSPKTTSSLFQSQFGKNKLAKRVAQDRPRLLGIEARALHYPCHRVGSGRACCVFRDVLRQICGICGAMCLVAIGAVFSSILHK